MRRKKVIQIITCALLGGSLLSLMPAISVKAESTKIINPDDAKESGYIEVYDLYNDFDGSRSWGNQDEKIGNEKSVCITANNVNGGLIKSKKIVDWRLYSKATVYAKHYNCTMQNQKENSMAFYTGDEIKKEKNFNKKFDSEVNKTVFGLNKQIRDMDNVKQYDITPNPSVGTKKIYLQTNLNYSDRVLLYSHEWTSVNYYRYLYLFKKQFDFETQLPSDSGMKVTKKNNEVQEIKTPFDNIKVLDSAGAISATINYGTSSNVAKEDVYSGCGYNYAIAYKPLEQYDNAVEFDHFDVLNNKGEKITELNTKDNTGKNAMHFDITDDFILNNYDYIMNTTQKIKTPFGQDIETISEYKNKMCLQPVFKLKSSDLQLNMQDFYNEDYEIRDSSENANEKILYAYDKKIATIKYNDLNADGAGTTYGDEFNISTEIEPQFKNIVKMHYEVRSSESKENLNISDIDSAYTNKNEISVKLNNNYYSVKPVFEIEGRKGFMLTKQEVDKAIEDAETELKPEETTKSDDNKSQEDTNKDVDNSENTQEATDTKTMDTNNVMPIILTALASLGMSIVSVIKFRKHE